MYTCFAVCFLEAPSGSHFFGIDACFVFASALQFQSLFQAFGHKLRFYKGVVDSFDSSSKKHKVSYDDGDEEILNFDDEKWEIDEDDDQDVKEGSHRASPEPSAD
ncbi:sister chromatid cohesion protein PDS5 like B-B, partial [Trifolium medium]|nr:sister chromatid cohesion protein PDS5 like B-B [Trifolium medium]